MGQTGVIVCLSGVMVDQTGVIAGQTGVIVGQVSFERPYKTFGRLRYDWPNFCDRLTDSQNSLN